VLPARLFAVVVRRTELPLRTALPFRSSPAMRPMAPDEGGVGTEELGMVAIA